MRKKMNEENPEWWRKHLVEDEICDEDKLTEALLIVGALKFGDDFDKVIKWSKLGQNESKIFWDNLHTGGFFYEDGIAFDEDNTCVSLGLSIAIADGILKVSQSEE